MYFRTIPLEDVDDTIQSVNSLEEMADYYRAVCEDYNSLLFDYMDLSAEMDKKEAMIQELKDLIVSQTLELKRLNERNLENN